MILETWKRQLHSCCVCIAVQMLVVNGSNAQEPGPETAADSNPLTGDVSLDLRSISESGFGQLVVEPRLMPSISPFHLSRYAVYLDLSEAQNSYVQLLYQGYRKAYTSTVQSHLAELAELSKKSAEAERRNFFSIEFLVAHRQFVAQSRKMNGEFDEAESKFFAQIKAVLSEPQLLEFWRVALDRDRRRTCWHDKDFIPARFDLECILEQILLGDEAISSVDNVLIDYEKRVTPLVVQLERALCEREIPLMELNVQTHIDDQGRSVDTSTPGGLEYYWVRRRQISAILDRGVRLQEMIHKVNQEFIPKFVSALPPAAAQEFVRRYRAQAYHHVYPDSCDPSATYHGLISATIVGDDLRSTLEPAWQEYQTRHGDISKLMEAEFERFWHEFAATQSTPNRAGYRENMRKLRDERWQLDEQIITRLRSLLPQDVLVVFERQLNLEIARIARVREDAQTDRYP